MESSTASKYEIVIVGGGICGLATALALHRKGVKSIVLERSNTLRSEGGGIGILPNGWRALDQLGIGSYLKTLSLPLQRGRDIFLGKNKEKKIEYVTGDVRCMERNEVIKSLAEALPGGTIRFGCEVSSVDFDSITKTRRLLLSNGEFLEAEIIIGCDGGRSAVAEFLGLKGTKEFGLVAIRGLTSYYPNAHSLPIEFQRIIKGDFRVGVLPITHHLVHWFVTLPTHELSGPKFPQDSNTIKQMAIDTLDKLDGIPAKIKEAIQLLDPNSLSFSHLRYRAPWDLQLQRLRRGTVTVAGDAMHVMGPFLGQGGCSALEDAVVLGRCLGSVISNANDNRKEILTGASFAFDTSSLNQDNRKEIVVQALDQYVKERRTRVTQLSVQTYLIGTVMGATSQLVKKAAAVALDLFFSDGGVSHLQYDCGQL